MEFKNKTVIITGGAVRTGKVTALEFAKEGANICIVDMDEKELANAKSEIEQLGVRVSAYVCDVSDEQRVNEVVDEMISEYGRIDVLVNNAAIWRVFGKLWETDSDVWKKLIDVNILGTMYFTKAVLKNMIENKSGRIINIGSVAGTYGNGNMATYSMTKGAIRSFTKAVAKEVAEYGITVNNVVPGTITNDNGEDPAAMSYIPRWGKIEEYAYLIMFLASDKAAYISGQDYIIDGCRKTI